MLFLDCQHNYSTERSEVCRYAACAQLKQLRDNNYFPNPCTEESAVMLPMTPTRASLARVASQHVYRFYGVLMLKRIICCTHSLVDRYIVSMVC